MDNFYKLILFFTLSVFSNFVLADTYPTVPKTYYWVSGQSQATYTSDSASCAAFSATQSAGGSWTITSTNHCNTFDSTGYPYGYYTINHVDTSTCPNGGTVSGSSCINAPACISPNIRKSVSPYSCFTPVECVYPEIDNGTGVCANYSCPTGQNRNPISKSCQTPPTCAATESYDILLNACYLKKLACPFHSHANTSNDGCLPDAPLLCPTGQHDDGTYKCVANDAVGCTSNQQYGTIFGVSQCIKRSNVAENNKTAVDAAAALAAAITAQAAAQAAKTAADSALAADPNNTTKQATAVAAQNTLATSNTALQSAKDADASAHSALDTAALKAIAENTRAADDKLQAAADLLAKGGGDIPIQEIIPVTEWTGSSNGWQGSSGNYSSCPAPLTVVTSIKTFSFGFEPLCNFATMIRPIFLTFSWFFAAYLVVGGF